MNEKVSWVGHKTVDLNLINEKINDCINTKHFTNNGKNVINLQKKLHKIFNLDDNKEVLLVCNGAMGLNALVGGLNIFFNKKIKFVVQGFTFPCSVQGLLQESLILDTDENMGPDIIRLEKYKNEYEGIFVTNCFGCSTNISLYEKFARENNKILLFDNAAAPYTIYNEKISLNFGAGCVVSLHHSKPIGFGEGGFIVFDKIYLESMKKAICFGYTDTNKFNYNVNASNYKMSEIAAIYIEEYLKNVEKIYNHHTKIIEYFELELQKINKDSVKIKLYKNYSNYNQSLLSTIPLIFPKSVSTDIFIKNDIEAKKYYYPLHNNCEKSSILFDKIICLPLNMDIDEKIIDNYISIVHDWQINNKADELDILKKEIENSNSSSIVKYISNNMMGNTFHHHYHILYDIRTVLGKEKKIYTEIGTFHGGSAALMLQHQFDTELYCIDPMTASNDQYEIYCENKTKFNKNNREVTLFKNYSTNCYLLEFLKFSNFKTDILFIDGDHHYDSVIFDFENFSSFVNSGGYIIFDDYLDYKYSPEVKSAVDYIINNMLNNEYEIIGSLSNYQNAFAGYDVPGLNEYIIKKIKL